MAKPSLRARSASQRAKKVLPQPYSPRTALKTLPPGTDLAQILVDRRLEPFQADRERIEAAPRHGAAPQGVNDLFPTLGA